MPLDKTPAEMAEEIKAAHTLAFDKVKEIADEALGKSKAGEELTAKLKTDADEALTKLNNLTENIAELTQKMDRSGSGDQDPAKSFGTQFIEDEDVKSWLEDGPRKGKADVKIKAALTMATTDADGSVGQAGDSQRVQGIIHQPERRLYIRDLLSQGRMGESSIEYVQETGFNNNAEGTAEGGKLPESDIKMALKATSAKVIGHYMKASRQALDDVHQLRGHMDGRLIYGLGFKEEVQALHGDGTGQSLDGLVTQAAAFAAAKVPEKQTPIDVLRLASLQAALAEYPATGHVINPIDWAGIELTKDEDGRYIIGNPQGTLSPTLWGLPVVATPAMTSGKFLTGAFKLGGQLWDRWDSRIEVGYENDDFTKNMVTILAEERVALTVYRPESFVYGDMNAVIS